MRVAEMFVVAIILPWLALMLTGRVGQGILCLLLQLTVIGWLRRHMGSDCREQRQKTRAPRTSRGHSGAPMKRLVVAGPLSHFYAVRQLVR
jgi:hypothetical protein